MIATLLLLGSGLCAPAQLRPRERFSITNAQVAARIIAAFERKGVTVEESQVSLPVDVSAAENTPTLEVRSIERQRTGKTFAVKLACSSVRVCLPFYAVVSCPNSVESSRNDAAVTAFSKGSQSETVIKPGAHVTMLMLHGTTRLQMPVVSIESGALHKQIRVRSTDRKQTFMTEIVDANTVMGTF